MAKSNPRPLSPRALHLIVCGPPQELAGAGTIDIDVPVTLFTSTGSAQEIVLPDGSRVGWPKRIVHSVDGGSGVITAGSTIHLAHSVASITLAAARDYVDLVWTSDGWAVVGYVGATFS